MRRWRTAAPPDFPSLIFELPSVQIRYLGKPMRFKMVSRVAAAFCSFEGLEGSFVKSLVKMATRRLATATA